MPTLHKLLLGALGGWIVLMLMLHAAELRGEARERVAQLETRLVVTVAARVRAERRLDSALAARAKTTVRWRTVVDSVPVWRASGQDPLDQVVAAGEANDRACSVVEVACRAFRDTVTLERSQRDSAFRALNARVKRETTGKYIAGGSGLLAGAALGVLACHAAR